MNIYLNKFVHSTFKKPGKALDLGAGDFFDVACMKQLGWKCEGVDKNMGINLEEPYFSHYGPFDLVYSNYVLQKIKNKKQFLQSACQNLKKGGWLFLHTFDASDPNSSSEMTRKDVQRLVADAGFTNIKIHMFSFYDNDIGHKHWHKILEVVGEKE